MSAPQTIVLLDCGDTIIDESTEIRDETGEVLSGDVIPGADQMVRDLAEAGFRMGLVADGGYVSFRNLLAQHGLFDLLETVTCTDFVRRLKPSSRMFRAALGSLDLGEEDASRCVMVGNNLARDIAGANRMGITSIHLAWTPRYPKEPAAPDERPDHTIHRPGELLPLLQEIEQRRLGAAG